MRAIVAYAPGDYRLEEVPVPEIGEGEILLKVEGCGICAGDLKAFEGLRASGDETQPAYIKAPMIPGHEFIGHVAALGPGVEGSPLATESYPNRSCLAGSAASVIGAVLDVREA